MRDPNTVAATHAGEEEIFTDPNAEPIAQEPADPLGVSLAYFPTAEGYYDYRNNKYIYQYKDHLGNVRLSYARNPTSGSIEVLDRNDYYAFGMNMYEQNSVYDAMGTPLNHKYNGKELQETGFYDYGWRQYMPDLGRWFGMDQLSEKYHMTSPYAYAVNNPVMFYDIDGRDLPGWLQTLWDKTQDNQVTTFGGFDSNGNAGWSKKGGSFNTEQFTSFVTFLQGGGTGNYTFWTNGSGSDNVSYGNGAYNGDIQGVIGYNINITDDKAGAWRGEQARSRLHAAMGDNIVDDVQGMLDGVGTVPLFGEVADGINGLISLGRGRKVQALLSFSAMVPFLGWGATAMKLGKVEVKALKFGGDEAINHFEKHASEIMKVTGDNAYNLKNYVNDANWIIQNGTYSPSLNGYYHFMGTSSKGKSLFGFVGVKNAGQNISTFHIKSGSQLGL